VVLKLTGIDKEVSNVAGRVVNKTASKHITLVAEGKLSVLPPIICVSGRPLRVVGVVDAERKVFVAIACVGERCRGGLDDITRTSVGTDRA
jgi:hypothetical protein